MRKQDDLLRKMKKAQSSATSRSSVSEAFLGRTKTAIEGQALHAAQPNTDRQEVAKAVTV